jgi:hypothetical protein
MDPLSFTASLIAVTTLVAQCSDAFCKLRDVCKTLPGRLHALNNEIADLHGVLNDVTALMYERDRNSIPQDEQTNIIRITSHLNAELAELKSIVEKLTASCDQSPIPLLQAKAWSRVQKKLLSVQEDIRTAKSQLNILLGASNSYVTGANTLSVPRSQSGDAWTPWHK